MYIMVIYLDVLILHVVLLKCNVTFVCTGQATSDQKITKRYGTRPVSECSSHEKQDERLQARWVLPPFNWWYFNYSQLGNCECDLHLSSTILTLTYAHTLYTNTIHCTQIHTDIYGYKHILVIHMLFEIDCFIRGFSVQVYDLLEYFNRALHINVWSSFKISYILLYCLRTKGFG